MDLKDKKKSQFADMMEDTKINIPRQGQKVTAKVLKVEDNLIYLDLHAATEGRMYLDQYTKKNVETFHELGVKEGDLVTAEIKKVQDDPALILLSRLSLLKEEHFEELEDALKSKEHIKTKIKGANKYGLLLDFKGQELFLPRSLLDHELYNKRDEIIGDELEVIVESISKGRGRRKLSIIATRKPIFEAARQKAYEERQAKRQEQLDNINTGDILTGVVDRLEPHAATIKFGLVNGLLRISQVTHYRIDKIEDVLSKGDEITVKVIKKEGNRLDLSVKALVPTPFEEFAEEYKVGDTIEGKIVQKLVFGLRVEVARGVVALLHKSEYSWNPNSNFDAHVVVGDKITLKIINIDKKRERINLSKKALEENPWKNVTLRRNSITEVTLEEITEEGLKVRAQGVEAFIPVDELGLEKGRPEDYYAVGDKFEAVVTKIDRKSWSLELSVKRVKEIAAKQEVRQHIAKQKAEDTGQTIGDIVEAQEAEKED